MSAQEIIEGASFDGVEHASSPEVRRCGAPRKSDGLPCRSTALGPDGRCPHHSDEPVDAAEIGRRGGIASGEARRELARTPRQRLADRADEEIEKVAAVFIDAMDAELPVTLVTQKDGTTIEKGGGPDHATRVRAAQGLLSEGFGRPPQAVGIALGGLDGAGPIELAVPPETFAAAGEILRRAGVQGDVLELTTGEGGDDVDEA